MNRMGIFVLLLTLLIGGAAISPVLGQEPSEIRTLFLYDDIALYPWSGFMGTNNGSSITLNLYDTQRKYGGVYSARVSTSGQEQWCGIAIQSQANNWLGPGIDLSGVVSVHFAVKGQSGGENVIFKFMNDQYVKSMVLTNQWQEVEVPFTGVHNFSSVNSLFTFVTDRSQKIAFNLDEIYFEVVRPQSGESPSLPKVIKGVGYNQIDAGKYPDDFSMIRHTMKANSLRFWGATDFSFNTLDKMADYDLVAFLPYWMPRGDDGLKADYQDATLRNAIKLSVLNYLQFYYPHPSLIGISLGNEVFHSLNPQTEENKVAFAQFLNQLCTEIHSRYPYAKVTYAAVGSDPLSLLKKYTPCLDIYGSNAYGIIGQVVNTYLNSGYGKPLLFLEYGCTGWWEKDWSDYSDEEKAQDYVDHWNLLKNRSLGGYAFTWFDKWEDGAWRWGIVNNDRSPRPQFTKLAEAYQRAGGSVPWLLLLSKKGIMKRDELLAK